MTVFTYTAADSANVDLARLLLVLVAGYLAGTIRPRRRPNPRHRVSGVRPRFAP